jgi:hypothetical protein
MTLVSIIPPRAVCGFHQESDRKGLTQATARLAISAIVSSGLRCVFGHCPTLRIGKGNSAELPYNLLEPRAMETFESLASPAPLGDGWVTLGLV